jgi:E3 ubiquitin-protein ligase NRDP1
MGFDIQRFPNCIDEELICSICRGVLQDPLQAPSCEHTFCQVKLFEIFS